MERIPMGDYSNMAAYYDAIMTSGYYDYGAIIDDLPAGPTLRTGLEIGCGTGLLLEELVRRHPAVHLTGIDLTEAMLAIARQRLAAHPDVALVQTDVVHMALGRQFDMVFSYGGVWFFIDDGVNEPFLASHITDDADNRAGLARTVQHLADAGLLCLGIQGPNIDYSTVIRNGMIYSQRLEGHERGFVKHYDLVDGARTVMTQTLHLRTYSLAEATQLLTESGLSARPRLTPDKKFMIFHRA